MREMAELRIEQWWLKLATGHKQWFRENLRADVVDPDAAAAVYEAGGPDLKDTTLPEEDWEFIETQSEFVD
jgi:hypothetical protein